MSTAAPGGARPSGRLRRALVVLTVVLNTTTLVFFALTGPSRVDWIVDLLSLLIPVAYGAVGAIIWARRPDNTAGPLSSAIGLLWSVAIALDAVAHWAASVDRLTLASWAGAFDPLWVLGVMLTLHLALRLPTGRLLSPTWRWWSRLCTATAVLVVPVLATAPGHVTDIAGTTNPWGTPVLQPLGAVFVLVFVAIVGAVWSLVLRYRRGSPVERLQLRWIALACVFLMIVGTTVGITVGSSGGFPPLLSAVDSLANASLPVAIGIAVLRYRLYDIDVVINRALVYGSLTATLAVTYVGLVLVIHVVVEPFTRDSALATATSTLAVAALFRPLRGRIQAAVDHRFYRSRYDAARTLDAFGSRLRDEVDLETLSADLSSVAWQTMQPVHVSLWLRGSQP